MTRIIPRTVMAVALSASVFACASDPEPEPESNPSLVGVVVDSTTGAPIKGATVRRYQSSSSSMETDESGAFEFTDATAAEGALITVEAEGYVFAKKTVSASDFAPSDDDADGDDADGDDADDDVQFSGGVLVVTIEMTPEPATVPPPEVRIIGIVTDNVTGMPVEGVSVVRHQSTTSEQTTAADGSFVFDDAEYAPAELTIRADGYVFATQSIAVADFELEGVVQVAAAPGAPAAAQMTALTDNASVTVQLSLLPQAPGVEVERVLMGHVFVQSLLPAEGAEVMLVSNGQIRGTTATDANGAFAFGGVVFANVSTEYQLIVAPFDSDGDGWADTGVDVTNGVCLYGITYNNCPDPNNGAINNVDGLSNVVLQLEAPTHDIVANNACDATFVAPGEDLYLMFDTSIEKGTFEAVLFGTDGAELATTLEWTGNYLVRIVPTDPLVASDDAGDAYRLEVRSVVFNDGTVLYDPTNVASLLNCGFRVGTNATPPESPEPRLWLNADETVAATNADEVRYFDAQGMRVRTANYASLQIVFPQVDGAETYTLFAKESINDDNTWTQVGTVTVGPEWGPDDVFTTVNLNGFGVLGEPLGFGNKIELMVKSTDSNGHVTPTTGSEPLLALMDVVLPALQGSGWSPDNSGPADTKSMGTLALGFDASMDVTLWPGDLLPVNSGRISGIDVSNANVYWGTETPTSATNQVLIAEDATFTVRTGADLVVRSDAGNGDNLLVTAELPVGFDLTGYSVGQQVGVADDSGDTVSYYIVVAINTKDGALTLSGGAFDDLDTVFDPGSRTDVLSSEAREGAESLVVADASQFFVGQSLSIRSPDTTDNATVAVESIDTGSDTLNITAQLGQTWPAGSTVSDLQLAGMGDFVPRIRTTLNSGNEQLVTPSVLTSATSTLVFNSGVNLSTLTVGDTVAFDADADTDSLYDRATAVISSIKTIQGDGTTVEDANTLTVVELGIVEVTFARDGVTSLPLDPTQVRVTALGDVVRVQDDFVSDTSGNSGASPDYNAGNVSSGTIGNFSVWGL